MENILAEEPAGMFFYKKNDRLSRLSPYSQILKNSGMFFAFGTNSLEKEYLACDIKIITDRD